MKTRRKTINTILLGLAIIVVTVSWSNGQTGDFDNLRAQIERNEELLGEAEALVRTTNSVKARAALDAAKKLHEASKTLLASNNTIMAGRSALRAREAITQAVAIARREVKLEEKALKAIEQASIRLERAKNTLDEQGANADQPANKMVDESQHQLHRAKNNMREHMFEVALHLANASIELSNRAIKSLKRENASPDKIWGEMARTDRLLERADENADPGQLQLMREAHGLQDRAKRSARENRFRAALGQTKAARAITHRVLKNKAESQEDSMDNVVREIALTDKLLDQAIEIAREQQDETAVGRLGEAVRIQNEAKQHQDRGQYKTALRLTLRARDIARNTMRSINKPLDPSKVKQALERTDGVLARIRTALENSDNEKARALFERAAARQASAWDAFESRQPRKALAHTKIARNLAQRARRQLGDEQI